MATETDARFGAGKNPRAPCCAKQQQQGGRNSFQSLSLFVMSVPVRTCGLYNSCRERNKADMGGGGGAKRRSYIWYSLV